MLVKFVSWVLSFEFVGTTSVLIATGTSRGLIYLAATLIMDLANLVNFLSVSDSSVKVV